MSTPVALALDIGGTKLTSGLVSSSGIVTSQQVVETWPHEGAERVIDRALQLARDVREACYGDRPSVLGIAMKGIARDDRVDLAGMDDWSRLRMSDLVRARLPEMAFVIVNDVKAATVGELTWGALKGVDNGIYFNFGTGIAAGLVAHGRLVHGAHGAAGEIAYVVPSMAEARDQGRDSHGDLRAPLEERLGGSAVSRRTAGVLGRALSMVELTHEAAVDPRAASVLDDLLQEIALWIVNVSLVTDPERVVIGGGFLHSGPGLMSRIRETFDRLSAFPPDVVPAHFGVDSSLVGVGAFALGVGLHESDKGDR
jgi:glucokinase